MIGSCNRIGSLGSNSNSNNKKNITCKREAGSLSCCRRCLSRQTIETKVKINQSLTVGTRQTSLGHMRATRNKKAQPIREVGLLASPLLLTLLLIAISSLISINCASLNYGRIQNYPSRDALASQSYIFDSPMKQQTGRNQIVVDYYRDGLPPLSANDEYTNYLLSAAAALASAKEQQVKPREYYVTSDEDNDDLARKQSSLISDSNNQYSLLLKLSPSFSSYSNDNANYVDDVVGKNQRYSIISNDKYNIISPDAVENDVVDSDDLSRLILAARISRSSDASRPAAYMSNNDYVIDDNNNNNNILINNQQRQSDQTEPLKQIEALDEESSANLALINKANRAKPVVSTLIEDDQKQSLKDDNGNKNKEKKLNGAVAPNASIGRLIERESDRTDKEPAPSWQLFLSRIYESVFGKPADVSASTAAPKTDKHQSQNEKHTKPSDVSSEQRSTHSDQHATERSATTTISKKDLEKPGAPSDKNHAHKHTGNEEADQAKKLVGTSEIEERHEDKKVATSTKKSAKMADVVDKVIQQNRQKHIDDNKKRSESHSHKSFSEENEQKHEEDQKISLMRKSTLVLPLDDLDADERIEQFLEEQQEQQSTPALYTTGVVYPLKASQAAAAAAAAASGSPLTTIWGATNNNNNNNLDLNSYKSFSRRYHPGEPIFGFAPQVVSNQPSGFAYRTHGNDLYFLVMVGAFCVMAIAMVLVASMFAYRVQQSRKSPTEMDYPTYGVVGPNSIAGGKLGASGASFVGGYFASNNAQAFGKGFTVHSKGCSNADLSSNNNNNRGGGAGINPLNSKNSAIGGSCDNGFHSPNDSGIASSTSSGQANVNGNSAAGGAGKSSAMSAGASKRSPSDARPPTFMASQQNAARIYHYQHQKQQMISSERNSSGRHTSASDLDSEEENEDGNYTVYECPGLASAHDMEIKNPLFNDDRSP